MLLFKRPKPPPGFSPPTPPPVIEAVWQKHKGSFIEAQHGKCGYCEQPSQNHPGAVEHQAPKGMVTELVADGVEVAASAKVKRAKPQGRVVRTISAIGYEWLAHTWNNWLFVCHVCNSDWKGCLYPVREAPRSLPPRPGVRETPLLLSPFGRVDPIRHLRFTRVGQIAPRGRSARGEATIRTCGLERETLRRARQGIAEDAHRFADRLVAALKRDDYDRAWDAVRDLLALGDEKRAHAGMVRSIVSTELGYSWEDLRRLSARLARKKNKRPARGRART